MKIKPMMHWGWLLAQSVAVSALTYFLGFTTLAFLYSGMSFMFALFMLFSLVGLVASVGLFWMFVHNLIASAHVRALEIYYGKPRNIKK